MCMLISWNCNADQFLSSFLQLQQGFLNRALSGQSGFACEIAISMFCLAFAINSVLSNGHSNVCEK